VEVKIGLQNVSRELVLDTEQSSDDIEKAVSQAISGSEGLLVMADSKGRKIIVPTDKLAYVEIGSPSAGQVGFRS
jgi:polysaccharide deacetylase 2 family uncharacterized protein YibQ